MKKLILSLVIGLLSACTTGLGPQSVKAVYDFGLPSSPVAKTLDMSSFSLEIKAIEHLDSPRITYRLIYENELKLQTYQQSRWVESPAALLHQSLSQQFGFRTSSAAACTLQGELQEFSHVFDTPDKSRGVIRLDVSLADRQKKVLSRKSFLLEEVAGAPDANGGVHALVRASHQLETALSDWLNALNTDGQLNACLTAQTSTISKPFSVLESKFGRVGYHSGNRFEVKPSTAIAHQQNSNYGWIIKVKSDRKTLHWKEEFVLPKAPKYWNNNQKIPGVSISPDRKVATTEKEVPNTDGTLFNIWSVAEGDPTGNYLIRVYVEGELVETFEFVVQ